jgi:small subunit ribosomal protein S1
MASEYGRHDPTTMPPPALDEGYWSSLLSEGDSIGSGHKNGEGPHPGGGAGEDSGGLDAGDNARDWAEMGRIAGEDGILEMPVVGYNRGGLLVEWRSLRGFVPASQLVEFPANGHEGLRRRALVNRVGGKLSVRVIELNPDKNRLILSERAALARAGERAAILNTLQPGDTIRGVVTNLCDFGAFVDLGGLEGLIHISELSWGRVGHPEHLLARGQEVQAYVLDIDREAARIALSIKRLRPDPWQTVEARYRPGEIVEGVVTNVVDFGAFACIEDGLEGLIHVSELAEGHFLHPRNVVNEGQRVRARILSIDAASRRLGLSLRLTE